MPFTSTGFETGTPDGQPTGWYVTSLVTIERLAVFGSGDPGDDAETFESEWDGNETYLFRFDPLTDIVAPLFDTSVGVGETAEDFEEGWDLNHGYSFTMGAAEEASFDGEPFDSLESGWDDNEDYSFTMGSTSAAMFDSGGSNREDFESGWRSNESYVTTFVATGSPFDDDFENVWGPIRMSVAYASSTLVFEDHGLEDDDVVFLDAPPEGGLLPIPLRVDTRYYVTSGTDDTIRLTESLGGSAITFSALGLGIVFVKHDPTAWWPEMGPSSSFAGGGNGPT